MFILNFLLFSLCLIIPIIIIFIQLYDRKTNAREQPLGISVINFMSIGFVFTASLILQEPSETPRVNNFPYIYMFVSNAFIFIPFLITRYFQTIHYTKKDQHYYFAFIFSSAIFLIGLIGYFNNRGMLGQILPFVVLLFFFLPLLPLYICIYYRNKR